jgi:cation:H+ antiporter
MIYVLAFLVSGAAVVLAAIRLAREADVIADATGLGRLWTGSVLLAAATSLPEIATDVSAVRLGAADLAVGDLFGSSMANMLILALVDLRPPRGRVLQAATLDHALAASLALSLNAIAAVLIFLRPEASLLGIAPGSLLLFLVYVAGSRTVYRHATRELAAQTLAGVTRERKPVGRAAAGFAGAALVVLVASPAFAWSAKGIAEVSGLGNTFVGTSLVGLSTSLPELVASLAAARAGAYDLAVGNLFGSNAINMTIFLFVDAAQPGSVYAAVDPGHVLSGLLALLLTSLGIAAIAYRGKRRFAVLEPDSLLMIAVYAIGLWLLQAHAAR